MDKFEIRVEGPFEYVNTDGPFTMEDLQRHWPEYLINYGAEFALFLFDNEGNVLRHELGTVEDAMQRDWVTLEEFVPPSPTATHMCEDGRCDACLAGT